MNTDQGRLFYATGIDNSQLRSDAAESRNILASIGQTAQDEGNRMDASFCKIAKAAGGIFAIGQVAEFAKQIISVRGEIESLEISFETLAGKAKGNALFKEIREFATSTPMMMKDLASGAQTMLAFNIEAEKVMPILRAIGDISMGDAQKFNSLSLAFSQMSATGKLMGQDLLQMINAGFNPLSVISEKTGKSIGDLKDEMEKGKITTEMVTQAFISATSAGGKFYGMLEKQSKGTQGAISNLQGAIEDMYNDLGTAAQGATVEVIEGATNIVKHYREIGEILAVIVGTYGVYKGAVITNEALIQAAATAKGMAVKAAYDSEIEALSALIPQKEAEAQTSLQQAVAAGHITKEKAAEIEMLRAEAQAQFDALAASEAAAKARFMASQQDVATALQWEKEVKEKIKNLEEESEALFDNGDSIAFNAKQEEIAALQSELLEVQKERESAVEAANTAATEMNAAAHQQNALATTEDSSATAVNTAQTAKNTGSTSALAIAKTRLLGVTRKLYASISAHPYAIAAAAVAALAYGIYRLVTYETEAEKAAKAATEAGKKANAEYLAETQNLDALKNRLANVKRGSEEWVRIKDAIVSQYGKYMANLDAEITKVGNLSLAYNELTKQIRISATARAMDEWKTENDHFESKQADLDAIRKALMNTKGYRNGMFNLEERMAKISAMMDSPEEPTSAFEKTLRDYLRVVRTDGGETAWSRVRRQQIFKQRENNAITEIGSRNGFGYDDAARIAIGLAPSEPEKEPGTWKEKVAEQRKALDDAQKELKKLQHSAKATPAEVKAARDAVDEAKKKLKDLGVNVEAENKSGNVNQQNADMFANEAADRRKQEEEYAKQVADQVTDSEFEIRQARIEAMKDGIDKEMMQNELNYDRLIEQNKRRERDLLDGLADEQMRIMEDADPTLFKRKNKDGKWEGDPGKRDEMYREIRAKLTIDDLTEEQKKQLQEFGKIASDSFERANKKSLENMLSEVLTYEEQRQKITEEYARKRDALYEKNEDGTLKTDSDGNRVFRQGVSQGNLDELDRQETEALKAVDEQFASREETYQAWCEEIANISLEQLKGKLAEVEKLLEDATKNGSGNSTILAQYRAQKAKLESEINKANAKNQTNPGKRTIKEWEDLYKTLNDVEKEFESIGDTVGGVVGDIISQCGQFATSTLQMINGIKILSQTSTNAIGETGKAVAKSIRQVEKASVILTIISAALQIATQIASLFNDDEKKQEEIDYLQKRIDQLQWELDHQEIGRIQLQYGTAISQLNQALKQSRLELAKGQRGWQLINTLTGQASRNQKLMQMTAEKLALAYGKMSYTADKALGAEKYKQANDQLKNLAQQQILIQEQINAEASKKDSDDGAIQEWKNKIEELGLQAIELINEMVEDIIGDTSTGIAEKLADAFFDAFQAGENAAEAWGEKVNEIVADVLKRMLVSKFLEEPLGDIFNKYKAKWFKDGQFQGLDSVTNSMQGFANDLNAVGADFAAVWENLPDSIKNMVTVTSDAEREASQKGIATASQDSVDELNGRMTAVQGHTFSISENTKLLVANTQAILRSVMNIETETEGFGARLGRMEDNIKEMNNTLDDIATKGIKLKS